MEVTRRFWAVATVALALGGLAVVTAEPLYLVGSVALGGWLLGAQVAFVRACGALPATLTVEQRVVPDTVGTGQTAAVTVTTALERARPAVSLTVRADLPPSASAEEPVSVTVGPGSTHGTSSTAVTWPVAGEWPLSQARVTARDATGLYAQSFGHGDPPTVTVEATTARQLHVGEGGERVSPGFGEHTGGRMGAGLEPDAVRAYVPGDALARIDWKATARLDEPHVREFQAETEHLTQVVVDARCATSADETDESPLTYLREVGLAVAGRARDLGDPLGLVAVDHDGVRYREPAGGGVESYDRVRRRLLDLGGDPTATEGTRSPTAASSAVASQSVRSPDDDSAYARTIRPYVAAPDLGDEPRATRPLYAAVESMRSRARTSTWFVVLTDDANRAELRETVDAARRGSNHVAVFLAPSVFFDPDTWPDVEAAYARYRDFEAFRRRLARRDRVTAFEVGPGDRVSEILLQARSDAGDGRAIQP